MADDRIMTVEQVAEYLAMTPSQVYTLTRRRSAARMKNPLPALRILTNLRFRKSDIDAWLDRVAKENEQ